MLLKLCAKCGAATPNHNAICDRCAERLPAMQRERHAGYEDTRAELQESQASTLSMVDALARLAEEEHKTSAEKAAMLELVEQLNEAVPSLSLAYDAQTDSLNLTAEAIRSLAEAEYARQEQEAAVGRLSECYASLLRCSGCILDSQGKNRERYRRAQRRLDWCNGRTQEAVRRRICIPWRTWLRTYLVPQ